MASPFLVCMEYKAVKKQIKKDLYFQVASEWPNALTGVENIEVGLSGGLDSIVLLHILWRMQVEKNFCLSAVHVHHGLCDQADDWSEFCAKLCAKLNIPLRVAKVCVETHGLGLEAGARDARYKVYSESTAGVLALAHHADDQVETFYLATLRGGGTRALAAMPRLRPLNSRVTLWRPLLSISRALLAGYRDDWQLSFVDDPSNEDIGLLRNWIRHVGLPVWQQRVPNLNQHVRASVSILQDECAILEEIAQEDWQSVHQQGWFCCEKWGVLSGPRRRQLLVLLAKKHCLGTPSIQSVLDFEKILLASKNKQVEWSLPLGKVYAAHKRLFIMQTGWELGLTWIAQPLNNSGSLYNELVKKGFTLRQHPFGIREDVLQEIGLIRAVHADDQVLLTVGHKSVRKILQERRIPVFVRKYWPVIVDSENQCIAIANIWVSRHHGCLNGFLPVFEKFNSYSVEPK